MKQNKKMILSTYVSMYVRAQYNKKFIHVLELIVKSR